jgi:hypothetical protein
LFVLLVPHSPTPVMFMPCATAGADPWSGAVPGRGATGYPERSCLGQGSACMGAEEIS